MELGHLATTYGKMKQQQEIRKQISGFGAHGLSTSQSGNALHRSIQAGDRRHCYLVQPHLQWVGKVLQQQQCNYSLFGSHHEATPLLQANGAL